MATAQRSVRLAMPVYALEALADLHQLLSLAASSTRLPHRLPPTDPHVLPASEPLLLLLLLRLALLLLPGLLTRLAFASALRGQPLRLRLAVATRTAWLVEGLEAQLRPSYLTVHPFFLRADVVALDALVKGLPSLLLAAGDLLHHGHRGQGLAGASRVASLAVSCLSLAWALAAYEAGHFKHRQVWLPHRLPAHRMATLVGLRLVELELAGCHGVPRVRSAADAGVGLRICAGVHRVLRSLWVARGGKERQERRLQPAKRDGGAGV